MKWIDINEELPIDTSKYSAFGTEYLVTAINISGNTPKTMVMEWQDTIIKGQKVQRWKWNGKLIDDLWEVTHWMQFPEPAI